MARSMITGRETQKMQEYTQERINQAERRGVEFPTDVKEQISEYANLIGEEEKVRTLVRNLADALSKADEESVEDLLDDARMDIQDLPDPTIGKLELRDYGYTAEDMVPLRKAAALDYHRMGSKIYCLGSDGSKGEYASKEMIQAHEAFYGIPAVLIAECKSRIDKGLMTDVLDEFDHVLGRSVDTYSDEVDETQANQMIEAAIDQYYIQQDKNGMLLFMEVMVTRMQQAGEVIVPYITENPFMSEEQISKVKAGDTISLDHDVRLKIETVKDSDEKEWIGVFTSSEEMHKGSAGNVQMNQSIESILRLALNWEQVNGIVINPFGKYIQMTKKMIELLINGYEYNENERKSKDDENN